ncbi:MAG TPA: transcription antitermination factor NusB [Gammaproteobacteria bacterium]
MSEVSLAKGRSNARRKAMQALYQWSLSGNDLNEIEVQFYDEQDMTKVDRDYFHTLLHEVPAQVDMLDQSLTPLMDMKKGNKLDPVEQAILRLAAYEIRNRLDVPYRVVINEAITLARTFGADQSHKFINGVLDKLAHEFRQAEITMKK